MDVPDLRFQTRITAIPNSSCISTFALSPNPKEEGHLFVMQYKVQRVSAGWGIVSVGETDTPSFTQLIPLTSYLHTLVPTLALLSTPTSPPPVHGPRFPRGLAALTRRDFLLSVTSDCRYHCQKKKKKSGFGMQTAHGLTDLHLPSAASAARMSSDWSWIFKIRCPHDKYHLVSSIINLSSCSL